MGRIVLHHDAPLPHGDLAAQPLKRNHSKTADPSRETVVLRVDPADPAQLPVAVSFLDRYGIVCDKVCVTHRDANGSRRSGISLTVAATDNLLALQARSSRIPLRDTAEVVGRRLADQLREDGAGTSPSSTVSTPWCRRRPRRPGVA